MIITLVFTRFMLWLAALGSGALQQPQCRVDDRLIYIYIYIERERDMCILCIYIYIYMHICYTLCKSNRSRAADWPARASPGPEVWKLKHNDKLN